MNPVEVGNTDIQRMQLRRSRYQYVTQEVRYSSRSISNGMKVILLQDVAKIGRRFQIVEVPHGFAMNKLIPQRLAKEATPLNVKQVQARSLKVASDHAAADAAFHDATARLGQVTVTVSVEANESGHLFQALKMDRVAEALKEHDIVLSAAQLSAQAPIKSVGEHTIHATSGTNTKEFTVTVIAK